MRPYSTCRMGRALCAYAAALSLAVLNSLCFTPATASPESTPPSDVVALATGMQRNAESINDFAVEFDYAYEVDKDYAWHIRLQWSKSGEFRVDELSFTSSDPDIRVSTPLVRRAFDGERLMIETSYSPEVRSAHYRVSATICPGTGMSKDMGKSSAMEPLGAVYGSEDERIWDRLLNLAASDVTMSVLPESHFGTEGFAIRCRYQGSERYFWIDPDHGFMPRIRRSHRADMEVETRAEGITRAAGTWFPIRIVRTSILPPGPRRDEWDITSVKINEGIPEDALHLRFKPGTFVRDEILGTEYVVGEISPHE